MRISNKIDELMSEEYKKDTVINRILNDLNEKLKESFYITWNYVSWCDSYRFTLNEKQYLFFIPTRIPEEIDNCLFRVDYINTLIHNPSNVNVEEFVEKLFFRLNLPAYLKEI
jgi:hypothetical protein